MFQTEGAGNNETSLQVLVLFICVLYKQFIE